MNFNIIASSGLYFGIIKTSSPVKDIGPSLCLLPPAFVLSFFASYLVYGIMVAIHFLVHFKRGQCECMCVCVMYMLTCMEAQVLVHMHYSVNEHVEARGSCWVFFLFSILLRKGLSLNPEFTDFASVASSLFTDPCLYLPS